MSNGIVYLYFNNQLVGYRAYVDGKTYDAGIEELKRVGISLEGKLTKKVILQDHNGLLMSKQEKETGKLAIDVSNDIPSMRKLFNLQNIVTQQDTKPKVLKNQSNVIKPSKGLAIVLVGYDSEHGEYQTISSTTTVYLLFSTKTAVKQVAKIIGRRIDEKSLLNRLSTSKVVSQQVTLDSYDVYQLERDFNAKIGITKDGFNLHDRNHYSDSHVNITLVPPNFNVELTGRLEYASIGTTADGGSLESYLEGLRKRFESNYIYYPNMTLSDIRRL